jgi:serine/threonine protein kinase
MYPDSPIVDRYCESYRLSSFVGTGSWRFKHGARDYSITMALANDSQSNIFVSSDGQAIVADFGMTMHDKLSYDSDISTETPGGTFGWQAPELMQETRLRWLAPPVDIFAFGCVAYAVCTPSLLECLSYLSPFIAQVLTGSSPGSHRARANVKAGNMPAIPPDEYSLPCNGVAPSAELHELIKRCWALQPEERLHITDVLKLLGHHTD